MIRVDKYGLVSQIQRDGSFEGGDSAGWTGHRVYLEEDMDFDYHNNFKGSIPGSYVRHPDPEMTINGFGAHYKHPWNGCISNEQLIGVLAALIRQKKYGKLFLAMMHHMCWFMLFSYNTIHNGRDPKNFKWKWPDPTGPDIWQMYLRGFGYVSYLFYPLLCVLDLYMLVKMVVANFNKSEHKISFTIKFLVSVEYVQTPVSWLTKKIMRKDHIIECITRYWSGWRKNPGMADLYANKLNEVTK